MKKELIALREKMSAYGIDYYIVPTTDFHGSEFVNEHFMCRQFVSGFTGDAGTLVVARDEAWLWTDGRFFIQAPLQLKDSGIGVMEEGEPGVPSILEYLAAVEGPFTLGFDGRVVSSAEGHAYESLENATIVYDKDLVDEIWADRPPVEPADIYPLSESVTGESTAHKLARIRREMKENSATHLLLTSMEEIAWLFNLRGDDIANTPVFFSFALLSESEATLFVNKDAMTAAASEAASFAEIRGYDEIMNAVSQLPDDAILWLNGQQANYAITCSLPRLITIVDKATPVELAKALKNLTEIHNTVNAHIKDGVAMVKFLHWIKDAINHQQLTEMSAAKHLDDLRLRQSGCFDLSFPTIAGYNSNGAIIHYEPKPDTDAALAPEGFLLVDSGGQYTEGTTDITRTIALGPLTDKMKEYYTFVLQSHIALSSTVFEAGTDGAQLDAIAREPLQKHGLDFGHGTGHGVGHISGVHEGPNTISKRGAGHPIVPGMITTDEPGVYIENEFGIRLENELLCEKADDGRYRFTPITFCPFDREAIVAELLSDDEKEWLNSYHEAVCDVLAPLVDKESAEWLQEVTRPIQ
jgi:Xaa-Pro aminopeptidase